MFLKSKNKEIRKTSKTVKNPNSSDTKLVTVEYSKTASELLKPIKQTKVITHKAAAVEKPNFDSIEPVTVKHRNSVTKLSKPIKQPEIITQKPK